MEIGLGALRFTPATFWSMSFKEFHAALEGYATSRGAKKGGKAAGSMSHDRLMELDAQYPDTPRTPRHSADGVALAP